ncbi:MAG: hypothetical protein KC646_05525 [Candidatus Cloacimonetes bacterium]|nr:hypothetical protein [Candidatus Cloacimonadota bacterium]
MSEFIKTLLVCILCICCLHSQEISLNKGWNLIGGTNQLASDFLNKYPDIPIIWGYSNNQWSFKVQPSVAKSNYQTYSEIQTLDTNAAYYVYTSKILIIDETFGPIDNNYSSLKDGYYLITSQDLKSEELLAINTDIISIHSLDQSNWKVKEKLDYSNHSTLEPLSNLRQGYGYWVKVDKNKEELSVSLSPSRTSCVAPCSILYSGLGSTSSYLSEPFHQLQYTWSFNDIKPSFVNSPLVNPNLGYSPLAAHLYSTPGTYLTTLLVSSSASSQTTSSLITIADPNVIFSNTTYCVSKINSFTACPTQDSNFHLSSYLAASELMKSLRFAKPKVATRVLFHTDETFDVSEQTYLRDFHSGLQISSYGSGASPILLVDDSSSNYVSSGNMIYMVDVSDISISNIHFKGSYNPTTGIGKHITGIFMYLGCSDITISNNRFEGMGLTIYPHGGTSSKTGQSKHIAIIDNYISDWQDYGVFGDFGYLGTLMGNWIKQNTNAISGSDGKCRDCVPNFPDHGPIRTAYPNNLLIQYNDMYNNAGWSSSGLAHQPNIRIGTGGSATRCVIADNILNGGFTTVSLTPANPTIEGIAKIGDIIIERNQFTASDNTWQMVDSGLGGSIIRNNLFLKPNNGAPTIGTSSFKSAIVFKIVNNNTTLENLGFKNRIYNNTLISNSQNTAANLALLEVNSHFSMFEIYNNLLYLPYIHPSGDGGLISWQHTESMTKVHSNNNLLYAPNTQNFVFNNKSHSLTEWQTSGNDIDSILLDPILVDSSTFNATLTTASPAINKGMMINGLRLDFKTKPRDMSPDIGALEF